jgi:hypothetical protein
MSRFPTSLPLLLTLACATALTALAGCDDADPDIRRQRFLSGCKIDKDCAGDLVCHKRSCKTPLKKPPAAAKPTPKVEEAPAANTNDLTVRLCPGYWGKSHNTGTVIAKNVATGKKHYIAIPKVVPDGSYENMFTFAALPHGEHEVVLYTGVIAQGKQDLLHAPCAEKTRCKPDKRTLLVTHGPPPSKEEWDAKLKQWAKEKYPGTDKELLRRPCDFDVDREI